MEEMVLSILTTQLDIEKEKCLKEEEEKLAYGKDIAQKVCVFGTKEIFVPAPMMKGYYDQEYSMIVLNQAKPKEEKIEDLLSSLAKAMILEKSLYYLNIPKVMMKEVISCIEYFLNFLLGLGKKELLASKESIQLAFGIMRSYRL